MYNLLTVRAAIPPGVTNPILKGMYNATNMGGLLYVFQIGSSIATLSFPIVGRFVLYARLPFQRVSSIFGKSRAVMDTNTLIEVNPQVMMGKPVIKGTRITVEMILESLSAGETVENLMEA